MQLTLSINLYYSKDIYTYMYCSAISIKYAIENSHLIFSVQKLHILLLMPHMNRFYAVSSLIEPQEFICFLLDLITGKHSC